MKRLLVAAMLVLAGCGTGPVAGQGGHGYRLVVEKLGGAEMSVVTTSPSTPISLPAGFLTADGSRLFSSGGQVFGGSAGAAGKTVLRAYDARSGALVRKLDVAGAWSWDGGGTSPDGRWLVLPGPAGFVVVDTSSGRQYPVSLDSHFSFDAISNDGGHLYLIETLVGTSYHVRLYNVFSSTLQVDPVVVKEPEVEAMDGYKLTAVADPDGHLLYSLYGRNDGRPPFVHALDLENAVAYCIDLPAVAMNGGNYLDAAASGWALSLDTDRHTLYASSARGEVVAIDTKNFAVVRSAAVTAPAPMSLVPSFLVDASAKAFDAGVPAASAVDPSGRWLYIAWETGFLPVETATLRPAALRDRGDHLSSLAVSPDGRHLFGVSGADQIPNLVVDLDPRTGDRQSTIGGLTYPWRILRLEPAL